MAQRGFQASSRAAKAQIGGSGRANIVGACNVAFIAAVPMNLAPVLCHPFCGSSFRTP